MVKKRRKKSPSQNLKMVGAKIRNRRKELELTQEELAERSNLSTRVLQQIEYGESDFKTETLRRLVKALELEGSKDILGF